MKMYICILENIPIGIAINSAAHASLMCHLKYQNDENYIKWLQTSFKKVTCKVTREEFEMCKNVDKSLVVTESRLDDAEILVVLSPRSNEDWPAFIKKLNLFK